MFGEQACVFTNMQVFMRAGLKAGYKLLIPENFEFALVAFMMHVVLHLKMMILVFVAYRYFKIFHNQFNSITNTWVVLLYQLKSLFPISFYILVQLRACK